MPPIGPDCHTRIAIELPVAFPQDRHTAALRIGGRLAYTRTQLASPQYRCPNAQRVLNVIVDHMHSVSHDLLCRRHSPVTHPADHRAGSTHSARRPAGRRRFGRSSTVGDPKDPTRIHTGLHCRSLQSTAPRHRGSVELYSTDSRRPGRQRRSHTTPHQSDVPASHIETL